MTEINENQTPAPEVEMAEAPPAEEEKVAPEAEKADESKPEGEEAEKNDEEMKPEEEKKEEPPKVIEHEKDDEEDSRPKIDTEVVLNEYDSSLNADISNGNICHALTADAFGHLIAGVRSNVGMKSGRYYFEVKLLETINNHHRQARNVPSTMVMVGLTTMEGDCLLNQPQTVAFTQDGDFLNGTEKMRGQSKKVSLTSTVGIMVNLIEGHENVNTISMFRDGLRASPPMKLPEDMHGKALFPTVNYKNASLTVNLGDSPLWKKVMTGEKDALTEIKVTQIGNAAKEDTQLSNNIRKEGEVYEVVMPVGLPDQGAYDWLDNFNKEGKYTEISNRQLMSWAKVTGHSVSAGSRNSFLDAPDMGLNVAGLDDFGCVKTLRSLAARKRRHYVIMNVRDNLLPSKRKVVLDDFSSKGYKVVADIIVGQPTEDFITIQKEREMEYQTKKMKVQAEIEDKRAKRDYDKAVKDQEIAKKKRKEELEKERAEKPAEEKKDVEMAEGEEKPAEEAEAAPAEEKEKEEEKPIDDILAEEFPTIEEPTPAVPKEVEIPADFKFRSDMKSDMNKREFERAFEDFTLPTTEEGFAEVKYLWSNEADAAKAIERYLFLKKIMVMHKFELDEDAKKLINQWGDQRMLWRKYYRDWHDKLKRAEQWRADQKKAAEDKPEGEEEEKPAETKTAAEVLAEAAEKAEGEEEEKKEEETIDYSKILKYENEDFAAKWDSFTVEDIQNIDGNGMPLFTLWQQEDWALAGLRYEVHCLLSVFKRLVPEDVRPGVHKSLFKDYFKDTFRREFVPGYYGQDNMEAFFKYFTDTMTIDEDGILQLENDVETAMSVFIRLTEESRRVRQARLDSGDESARLKFLSQKTREEQQGRKGKGKGKGKGRESRRDEPRRDDRRSAKGGGRDQQRSSYGKGASRGPAPPPTSYGGNWGGHTSVRGGGNSYGSYPMSGSGQKRGGDFRGDDQYNKRRNYGQSGNRQY